MHPVGRCPNGIRRQTPQASNSSQRTRRVVFLAARHCTPPVWKCHQGFESDSNEPVVPYQGNHRNISPEWLRPRCVSPEFPRGKKNSFGSTLTSFSPRASWSQQPSSHARRDRWESVVGGWLGWLWRQDRARQRDARLCPGLVLGKS